MSMIIDIVKKQKLSIIVTAAVMLLVSVCYFVWGNPFPGMAYVYKDATAYEDMKLKAGYKDGTLKVFALADPAVLADVGAAEGDAVPRENTVVIGWAESGMMRREGLFSSPGDTLEGFFGINPVVGGVLKRTYGLADDIHFLTESGYERVVGQEDRLFIALKDTKSPKLFVLAEGEDPPMTLPFAEGSLSDYTTREIRGKTYDPVILGSSEADMMKSERLFKRPGDTIGGFFGNDIVVVGVLEKTNTIVDMVHVSPLAPDDIK